MWLPPSPGEQVVIACIGGNPETAMIIGSLWSDAIPAPGKSLKEIVVSAPDGAVFRYDADAGALSASGMKTGHFAGIRQRDTGYARRGMHKPSENSRD